MPSTAHSLLNQLSIKQVRDLYWLITSPSILAARQSRPYIINEQPETWLNRWTMDLDDNPEPLLKHLSLAKSHFLGSYVESLWAYFLIHHPLLTLRHQNLQVSYRKKTVGEFDFIVHNERTGEFEHHEIAIKYYLSFPSSDIPLTTQGTNSAESGLIWLGPQCKDRLDLKYHHMLTRQSTLGDTPAGLRSLQDHNIDGVIPRIMMKGYLFKQLEHHNTPGYCSDHATLQSWIYLSDLDAYAEQFGPDTRWAALDKPDWLSPYRLPYGQSTLKKNALAIISDKTTPPLDSQTLITLINERVQFENRPWMIAMLNKTDESWQEMKRIFVVPKNWPHAFI